MDLVGPRLGYDIDLAAAELAVLGVEVVGQNSEFAIESRLGMMAVPMFTSSSASLPFTMKAFANSRWPLMEMLPGLKLPDGEKKLAPTS